MYKSYDREVWFLLREIWCAVPKVSYELLCKIVAEATGKDTPSPDSVRKKCKAENWTKNVRNYCRKSDKTLDNIKSRLLDEIYAEYEKIQSDNESISSVGGNGILAKSGIPKFPHEILGEIAKQNRTMASAIQDHRRRVGKAGQLLDDSMDCMYVASNIVLDPLASEEKKSEARVAFNLLEVMVEKIEIFSRTAKNLMQMDAFLFGMTSDDTRDSDASSRMATILDDTAYNQAREDLNLQYAQMREKTAWIQSGDFEREVQEEKEERMRQEDAEQERYIDHGDDDEEVY